MANVMAQYVNYLRQSLDHAHLPAAVETAFVQKYEERLALNLMMHRTGFSACFDSEGILYVEKTVETNANAVRAEARRRTNMDFDKFVDECCLKTRRGYYLRDYDATKTEVERTSDANMELHHDMIEAEFQEENRKRYVEYQKAQFQEENRKRYAEYQKRSAKSA